MKTVSIHWRRNLIPIVLTVVLIQSCSSKKTSSTSSAESSFTPIATGQVNLYDEDGNVISGVQPGDSLYGQDASYLKGKKMAYHDNGDGTVSDLNSGLMWQAVPTTEEFDWNDAKEYCENLELGGYDDWRMPTAKELFSISDFSSGWPYIDTTYFSLVDNEHIGKDEQYWADNHYVGYTEEGKYNAAFGVNYATGHIKAYAAAAPEGGMPGGPRPQGNSAPQGNNAPPKPGAQGDDAPSRPGAEGAKMPPRPREGGGRPKGNPLLKYVRAVRGNAYGVNNFQDNGDGTITDAATGLMWAKDDSGDGMDWKEALYYAENSELGGYSDWRLPNVKELQGIVDYSYAPGAEDSSLDGPAIDPLFHCSEIVNENGDQDYPYYWTSTSARFQKGKPYYYAWYVAFGRAVNGRGIDSHGAGAVRFDTKHENGPAGEGGERYYNYVRLVRSAQ